MIRIIIDIIIIVLIIVSSIDSYRKKSLSKTGAIAAGVLGCVLYISGGFIFLTGLFAFYFSSSYMTKYRKSEKENITNNIHVKSGERDWIQVFANGGIPLIISLIYLIEPSENLITLIFIAFSVSNSDTWASEIGVLSDNPPISVLTLKKMKKGVSGGISLLGLLFSFLGAVFIGVFYIFTRIQFLNISTIIENLILITVFGFLGSVIDSIFGATIQPLYINEKKSLTEKSFENSKHNLKVKGNKLFNNDVVNFLSILIIILLTCLYFFIKWQLVN